MSATRNAGAEQAGTPMFHGGGRGIGRWNTLRAPQSPVIPGGFEFRGSARSMFRAYTPGTWNIPPSRWNVAWNTAEREAAA